MELTIDDVSISKFAAQVVSEIRPIIQGTTQAKAEKGQRQEIEELRKENQALSEKVTHLEMEVKALKACVSDMMNQQQDQEKSDKQPSVSRHNDGQCEVNQELSLEYELKENLSWLDEACHFKKAEGRTWRQLSKNYGSKITMNGKGQQTSRAYLHAIESWQECKPEARMKARIALEVVKNGD